MQLVYASSSEHGCYLDFFKITKLLVLNGFIILEKVSYLLTIIDQMIPYFLFI